MCHCHLLGQNYKMNLDLNVKKEPLHPHSIHSAEKYPAYVAKKIFFLYVLLRYWLGQLTSLPNHPHHYALPPQNKR